MPFQYDEEMLIFLVEERPALWDSTVASQDKMKLWKDIFMYLDNNFERADELGKQIIGETIMNKWHELREAFLRALRKGEECQYFDRLWFLRRTTKWYGNDAATPAVRPSSSSTLLKSYNQDIKTKETSEGKSFSVQQRHERGASVVDDSHSAPDADSSVPNDDCSVPDDDSNVSDNGGRVSDDDSSVSAEAGYWSVADGIVVERFKSSRRNDDGSDSDVSNGRGDTDNQRSSPKALSEDDRFFLFVASSMRDLDENEKLEFRVAVLRLMQGFKYSRAMALDHCRHRCQFTCQPCNGPICHSPPPATTGHCGVCVRSTLCQHTPSHGAPSSGSSMSRSPMMGLSAITRTNNQYRN